MSLVAPMLENKDKSFLIEELLDYRSLKESALERAAQITSQVTSLTLGPNSSYRLTELIDDEDDDEIIKSRNAPKSCEKPARTMSHDKSPLTTSDLRAMQQKLQWQDEERKLKEDVRKKMEERLQCENEHNKRVQNLIETMKVEAERKQRAKVEALGRQIENALRLEEQDEMIYQEQRKEMTKNRRKILEQQEKELRDSLKKYEDLFSQLEGSFNKIIQSCNPDMSQIIEAYKKHFEIFVAQKNANRSSLDGLKTVCIKFEELCRNLIKASKEFEVQSKALQAQKEAAEKQAQASAAEALALSQAQEAEKAAHAAQAQAVAKAAQVPPQIAQPSQNNQCGRLFNELMHHLHEKHNATKQLSGMREMETLRFALKLAVNNPINILNEENKTSLIEGFQKLHNLLAGQRVTTSKGAVSITDHPEASDWTKLRLAEKLIDACDKKPQTKFFVAALTVALWQKFPDFGRIFIAKLFEECPFLVPYKPSQLTGQTDQDFLKSWGFRVTEKPEVYLQYQLRTSNFAGLLAAIWITQPKRDEQSPHPLGIDNCWTYFINIMNTKPDPMFLHLIDRILDTSGSTMHATFGKQFCKILLILRDLYLPSIEGSIDIDMKGSLDRLKSSIDKFFAESRFQPPKGKLAQNFW